MQTQRDHVHAHQFQMTRMSNALVAGDAAGVDNPFQRPIVGLLTGALVAVLTAAGFLVYGWLVPGGNTSWQKPGTIIVEKESGDRYVFAGGQLLPVRNMASALLLQGPSAAVELVSHSSLRGVPRGPAVGLTGAPQTLPSAADVVGGPWMACLAGDVHLDLDPAAPATPLGESEFALVASAGKRFLLWHDTRFEVTEDAVPIALGAAGATPVAATPAWLESVPAGEPISVPQVPGQGKKGPPVAGHTYRIGQLFTQTGGGQQQFVLRGDGLAPVSGSAFTLLRAISGAPVALSAADIVAAPASPDRSLAGYRPELAGLTYRDPGGGSLCLRQSTAGAQVVIGRDLLPETPAAVLAPGTAMIAYALPVTDPSAPRRPWLITDDGVRYDVSDKDALSSLKLSGGPQVGIPAPWLAALPAGPVLSRAALTGTKEG